MNTPGRVPLIAGNWKMNGSLSAARTWAEGAQAAAQGSANEVAVFPPAPWLLAVGGALADAGGGVALGGQACSWEAAGAFTGAVAA
ncbi:MAG: triose-phosphate isomerase, partial [Planctomycetota bacterium]|nr:triose-phosphate isomerase [Planctomycetota bacterium]